MPEPESQPVHRLAERARLVQHDYSHGEPRPLGGYAALLGTYVAAAGATLLALRRRGRLPSSVSWVDLALIGVTTQRVTRIVTKDSIASVVRAPFTVYEGAAGEGEVTESVRQGGLRHAIGELLTCPFCLSQWVATTLTVSSVTAPDLTRMVTTISAAASISDWLQFGYSALQQTAE